MAFLALIQRLSTPVGAGPDRLDVTAQPAGDVADGDHVRHAGRTAVERTRATSPPRAGGVGLITVGATGIDPRHPETPGGLHLGTDDAVAAHRALVEAVHEHGAKIQPQIVHAGPDGLGPEMHGVTSLGPSVIPSYLTGSPSPRSPTNS